MHNKKFLAMHQTWNKKSSKFELPGGKMEFGETAEQTVAREVFEETKLNITPIKLLDTWNFVGGDFQISGVIFLCTAKTLDDFSMSTEHDSFEWLTPNTESFEKMQVIFRPQMFKWNWAEIIDLCIANDLQNND